MVLYGVGVGLFPTVVIIRLETGETTIPGVGRMEYGVCWFPTVVRIRLSQPPAGDWLTGAWAELGNMQYVNCNLYS